jgi:hypothetical protein
MKFFRRFRLSTLLLSMIVLALLSGLYVQKRQEARLQADLALYRDPTTEGIIETLDRPLALAYVDGATLEVVLKEAKLRSTGRPKLKSGLPIYVDPIGLQEAEKSMTSTVRRPLSADTLPLGDHLRSALDSLGLGYVVKDGFLMITSKESLDTATGDATNPYLLYRDVLR